MYFAMFGKSGVLSRFVAHSPPDFKKIKTKRKKTYKNKGSEDSQKSIYIEKHSSVEAYEAERIPEI